MLVNKAHNSRMIMKIEHEVINLCIMGGGLVQSIRTTLPQYPCLHLNQVEHQIEVSTQDGQVKLLESMMFSSFLNNKTLIHQVAS